MSYRSRVRYSIEYLHLSCYNVNCVIVRFCLINCWSISIYRCWELLVHGVATSKLGKEIMNHPWRIICMNGNNDILTGKDKVATSFTCVLLFPSPAHVFRSSPALFMISWWDSMDHTTKPSFVITQNAPTIKIICTQFLWAHSKVRRCKKEERKLLKQCRVIYAPTGYCIFH